VLFRSDVCIIPFVKGGITEQVNPVKLFEYVAMNKSVVATRTDELEKYSEYCFLYEDESGLESLIESLVENGDGCLPWNAKSSSREDFIEANTWEKRVEDIGKIIEERAGKVRR